MVQLKLLIYIAQTFTVGFQFHDGTIKTFLFHPSLQRSKDFNSMMVQLKLIICQISDLTFTFQFHDGTIKTRYCQRLLTHTL